jgi:hypothetical protein
MAAAPYFQPAHWDRTWQLGIDALMERGRRELEARVAAPTSKTAARTRKGRNSAA